MNKSQIERMSVPKTLPNCKGNRTKAKKEQNLQDNSADGVVTLKRMHPAADNVRQKTPGIEHGVG